MYKYLLLAILTGCTPNVLDSIPDNSSEPEIWTEHEWREVKDSAQWIIYEGRNDTLLYITTDVDDDHDNGMEVMMLHGDTLSIEHW